MNFVIFVYGIVSLIFCARNASTSPDTFYILTGMWMIAWSISSIRITFTSKKENTDD